MTKIYLRAVGLDPRGIIVPMSTGVPWENQVGGNSCGHWTVEGIFVPVPFGESRLLKDMCVFSESGYTEEVKAKIAKYLRKIGADCWFEAVPLGELDRDKFPFIAEAWIPVRVLANSYKPLLGSFKGQTVILTCRNSD